MDAGRLDEAFSLLTSSASREHRDAQVLVDQIIVAFVARGNEHFEGGRYDDAWQDAEAAAHLGGRQIEIAKLRQRIKDMKVTRRETTQHPESTGSLGKSTSRAAHILQVDGLGSLLLLQNDRVSIGTASSSMRCDLTLQTEGDSVPMLICRDDEDYFAESTSRRLLASGDSITVGQRGRLRFTKPVPASSSAILEVTGAKLPRRDIRRVVLLADSLLFGSSACHFCLPVDGMPIIMQPSEAGYTLHRQGGFDIKSLAVGDSVRIDDTRFALTPYLPTGAIA